MANLVSPGVQVTVTDESVYGPTGTGTVPMLFIATGQDKVDPTGTSTIAAYTAKAKAGKPVLVTSQRELSQFFGNIDFRKVSATVQQGDETNEYGLLAAYSFLGQSAAAYIVRADVDLTTLRPASTEPTGPAANKSYWINPSKSNFGMFEYTANGWVAITPTVEITDGSAPTSTVVVGGHLVAVAVQAAVTEIEYYKEDSAAWATAGATLAPHYSEPASPSVGDIWVKTTSPGSGFKPSIAQYTTAAGAFVALGAKKVCLTDNANVGTHSPHIRRDDGSIRELSAQQLRESLGEWGVRLRKQGYPKLTIFYIVGITFLTPPQHMTRFARETLVAVLGDRYIGTCKDVL